MSNTAPTTPGAPADPAARAAAAEGAATASAAGLSAADRSGRRPDGGAGDARGPGRMLRAILAQASAPPLTLALATLNHVIRQQGWARQRLRPFAGQTIRLALDGESPPARWLPPLQARVGDDGYLQTMLPPARAGVAGVTLWLRPSIDLLAALAAPDRELRVAAHLRIEGDVMLATALAELARHLRWDVEDDLSHLVGDVAAHRIGRGARAARDQTQRLASRAKDSAMQFVTAEQPMLVPGSRVRDRALELGELEQRLVRLRARIDRLTLSRGPTST